MDPSTGENFSSNEVLRCIQIGLLCTLEAPIDRPPMSSVFLMLHGPSTALGEPRQPQLTGGTSVVDTAVSRKESELRASEEFGKSHQLHVYANQVSISLNDDEISKQKSLVVTLIHMADNNVIDFIYVFSNIQEICKIAAYSAQHRSRT